MSATTEYNGLEIAIIGMSAQFPKSADHRQYWQNLREGRDLLKNYTDEELRGRGVSDSALKDNRFVKTFGEVDHKDYFDAHFFGYTSQEASLMDPQIRLFHEHCWRALEDSGYSSCLDKIKTGLFTGASVNENWKIHAYSRSDHAASDPFFSKIITSQNFISTLISYKLNLSGPSFYIDTACSTSLAAVHLACRSLLTRDCMIALAGGVSLTSEKKRGYFYQDGMISSKDGNCRAFDAQASGTTWGEGTGVIVLKRLKEAIDDRDHIYAVIKATAVNNDGNHKVGYTAPGVKGQTDCIMAAQRLGGIDPRSIGYVEAHGTGTKLGDPVEIRALNEAFGTGGGDKFCAIGSVKTNMGHLDAAAGIAGLIKTALSLQNGEIPPSLHFKSPNSDIDFDKGPFFVNTRLKEWPRIGMARLRAGVSSFGIGGTNAHAILEEAPVPVTAASLHDYKLLTLSAKTEASLLRYLDDLQSFLRREPATDLADMAYTLQVGRKHFTFRSSIVFREREELIVLLEAGVRNGLRRKAGERKAPVIFMFPGQGSQYTAMGKDLYEKEPFFRKEMENGFSVIEELTGEDFRRVLFPEDGEAAKITSTRYAQPLLFLIEYSMARWMMSIGLIPQYMIGHSIGEYTAACISGVFSFGDALRLVVARGKLMDELPAGAMLSVPLPAREADIYLNDHISLAAENGPGQVVFSGELFAIEALKSSLDESNIPYLTLHTSHAFHSAMLDPIKPLFEKELKKITFHKVNIPFLSGLTGDFIKEEQACSVNYWIDQLRETVKFSEGLQNLSLRAGEGLWVETGPGHALTSLLKQQELRSAGPAFNLMRSFKETENDSKYLWTRIGELWAHGIAVNWEGYYGKEKRNRVSLPAYSFEPTRYAAEVDPFESGSIAALFLPAGSEMKDWIYYPSWKRSVLSLPEPARIREGCLLFSTGAGFSALLKQTLSEGRGEIIEVLQGKEYEKISPGKYIISPDRPEHFERLIKELKKERVFFTDILYAWGMEIDPLKIKWEPVNTGLNLIYFSIIMIIRALDEHKDLNTKRMVILTDSLHKVIGTENGACAQSLMLGLANVIPREYPVSCLNIDIDLKEGLQASAGKIVEEMNGNSGRQDRVIAFRHSHRWVQEIQKNLQPLKKGRDPLDKASDHLKKGGVYLITGGLGNLGFTLAKHLIRAYDAKLIITGRRKIPDSQNITAGNKQDTAWERFAFLKNMNEDVRYFSADISDFNALKRVVETSEEIFGPIQGVIHAAGIIGNDHFEWIEESTIENTLQIFAPKIKGIENIYECFRDRALDFVWISSSLSTVLGGLGFSAYCAANLYMDHFISSKPGELGTWKCLDLTGIALAKYTEPNNGDLDPAEANDDSLGASELISLFEYSLCLNNSPVILVNKGDLVQKIRKVYQEEEATIAGNGNKSPLSDEQPRTDLSKAYAGPVTGTEKKLKTLFETLFDLGNIGTEDSFFELGGDSLKGMMLLKRIKKEFGVTVAIADLFKCQTIRQTASLIDELGSLNTVVKRTSTIII